MKLLSASFNVNWKAIKRTYFLLLFSIISINWKIYSILHLFFFSINSFITIKRNHQPRIFQNLPELTYVLCCRMGNGGQIYAWRPFIFKISSLNIWWYRWSVFNNWKILLLRSSALIIFVLWRTTGPFET